MTKSRVKDPAGFVDNVSSAMPPQFSVIIPFYNEAAFLPRTLRSWLEQTRLPDEIVLVDNGSTDGSAEICRQQLRDFGGRVVYESDERPGKVNALESACANATGTYLALSDADTYYPPHYLELAETLIGEHGESIVALMAHGASSNPQSVAARLRRRFYTVLSGIATKQAFTGGYGQIIKADVLEEVGGFSEGHWPYVLLDHEIMHRLLKRGASLYHEDLWCIPSSRRRDRSAVRWTLPERVLYFMTPFRFKDWFFYDFLALRLKKRGMTHLNLREKTWE